MRRDPRVYLWDALNAADLLTRFSGGKTFEDYRPIRWSARRWNGNSRSSARR
ncbi:hypothetical protein GCM10022243_06230 [Saccharothrix violaceirubra]|uniref:Uncharacterized protein with HEPN domain n=1 Tax=Saccharothrix violaceirubra TaxID=413306 RepID=A0A7W7WTC0_9PSEU|nr:hypothetical protein [Saccharothrix violaceirubra]MBB4963035.1 uncharacterized protein with HEPN domain [Saccharothrix violaceirubra]